MKVNSEPQQVSDKETAIILELLEKTAGVDGDIVELGCYRGDTSLLLERAIEKDPKYLGKKLWIYDSFAGLPDKTSYDSSAAGDNFKKGELAVSKHEVILRFKKAGLRVPRIRKGFFEDLDEKVDFPEKISLAFLDGDLYQSIMTSLELVWAHLEQKSVVIVHDYNNPELPGATRAVDEWLDSHRCKISVRESLAILTQD